MKTPIVDKNTCISCGTCTALCPNSFKFGDDYKAEVYAIADDEATIQSTIDSCPSKSISWVDEK